MTTTIRALGFVVGLGCASTLAIGCFDLGDDCAYLLTCTSSTSTSSSSSGTGVNCDPLKGAVDGNCGVFVSSSKGDDGNGDDKLLGTPDKPFKTLSTAIARAGSGRVYACGEGFTEAVKLAEGVTLYGALDCDNGWTYDAMKKTVLTAAPDAIPLVLASTATGAEVFDFAISSQAATKSGGSSIAVLVDHATATFTRCDLVAGDAVGGAAGASGGEQANQADPGVKGDDAGTSGPLGGGAGASNAMCSLKGGNGGDGGLIPSADGSDGTQGDGTQGGTKGAGQTMMGACTNGGNGDLGTAGDPGLVTPGFGSVNASGYQGVDGQDGGDGGNGKSGGGGGGSKATVTAHGAGGGGGGAGGCGGKKGTAGKAGGSSIALVSINATVTLAVCTLAAGAAGDGGAGGDGQFGQLGGDVGSGGKGGSGAAAGCNGGKGGDGGNGGNGSGGLGGHSLGIALTGNAPVLDDATKSAIKPAAKGGTGGPGGRLDADMNHGAEGKALVCWDFEKGTACSQ